MKPDVRAIITWLHLSDVHFGRPGRKSDSDEVLRALLDVDAVKSLAQGADIVTPDLLFFTGDLAYGDPKEFSLTDQLSKGADFLHSICKLFDPPIHETSVFIVPGNHDLDRDKVTDSDKNFLAPQEMTLFKIEEIFNEGGRQFKQFILRQEAYRKLICEHFPHISQALDNDRLIYSDIKRIGGWKLGIAGFNSSWSCCQDGERGKLWMGGRAQSQRVLPKLEDADFRVALLHHPPWWLTEEDARDFWQHSQSNFDVTLHGHEHMALVDANQFGHVRIAAGALYEHRSKPASFNLVKFSPEGRWGQVWLRTYDSSLSRWVPDSIYGNRGVCTLDRFGRSRPVEDAIAFEAMHWLYSDSIEEAKRNYGQVTNLNLAFRPLEDLEALKEMTELRVLYLRNTLVRDLRPLRNLTRLERLGLASTFVRDLRPLSDLKNLVQLALSHTKVCDLIPLDNLIALQELDLRHTRINSDKLKSLENLTGLQKLYVGGTKVQHLKPLAILAQLQKQKRVSGLKTLGLMETKVDNETLKSLAELTDLCFLSLRHTNVSDLAPLADLINLGELRLANTKVHDLKPLKGLSNLKELDLINTPISSLRPLHGLTELRRLHLRGVKVKQEEITALEDSLPALNIILY